MGENWRNQHKNAQKTALFNTHRWIHNKIVTNIYSIYIRFCVSAKVLVFFFKYFWRGASELEPSFVKKKMDRFNKQSNNLLLHSDSVISFWCETASKDAFVQSLTQRSNYNAHPIILSITLFSFTVHTAFNALTGDFKMIFAVKPLVDEGVEKPDRTRNLCKHMD